MPRAFVYSSMWESGSKQVLGVRLQALDNKLSLNGLRTEN